MLTRPAPSMTCLSAGRRDMFGLWLVQRTIKLEWLEAVCSSERRDA